MKKSNLALFTLFVIALFSLFTQNTLAQKPVSNRTEQPKSNITKKDVLQNYVDVSSLPINKRSKFFSELSIEEKAHMFSLHLALQFVKRPKLTNDQKDLILESISSISADTYDRTKDRTTSELYSQSLQARVLSVFEKKEAFEIFASLGGDVEDVEMIRNYQGIMLFADVTDRQEAFGKTTPSNKSNFWKIRFLHHLTTNPDLNPEQKSLLIEMVSRINKDLYINRNQSELVYKQETLMPLN